MNKIILGVVALVLIVGGVAIYQKSSNPSDPLAGTSNFEKQSFVEGLFGGRNRSFDVNRNGNVSYGSGCFATSTTGLLTQANLIENNCIKLTATGAGQGTIALTLPAVSAMPKLIPVVGQCRDWFVDASALAAATTTTFLLGTGHDIVGLDATGAGTGADVIDGQEYGTIKMCRKSATAVVTFIHEYIHAD